MRTLILLIIVFTIIGCSPQESIKTTENSCLKLGSAFYPGALISADPKNYVTNYNENLILFHFGDSVPWEILANCEDIDNCKPGGNVEAAYIEFIAVMDNLQIHSKSKPVYLAVSPINNDRNGIATNWDSEKRLGFNPPGDSFDNEQIRSLYKKWVRYLVDKFDPEYLSQAIEFNMYSDKQDFDHLITLLQEIKQESRTTVIGPTIQWEFFKKNPIPVDWNSLGTGFAFSTYPHIFDPTDTNQVTDNHYNFEQAGLPIDNKPLFISESGIQHEYQKSLLQTLFGLKERHNLQAVIWFFKEDAKGFFDQLPNEYPFTAFHNSGLYKDTGSKNPGAKIWEEKLACI